MEPIMSLRQNQMTVLSFDELTNCYRCSTPTTANANGKIMIYHETELRLSKQTTAA